METIVSEVREVPPKKASIEVTGNYVSLNTHSSFSTGQGIATPKELFEKAKEYNQKAVAVTDVDTMAGMWECLNLSRKTGIKFIAGCEFNFVDDVHNKEDTRLTKLVLIARNYVGYQNLLSLRKEGFDKYILHFKKSYSRIDWKLLERYSDGLICLSGDGNGFISQLIMEDKFEEASAASLRLKKIFGEYFALELQPNNLQIRGNAYSGNVDQRKINLAKKKIHDELGIKCVVATGSYYTEKEHHDAQDVLLAISCNNQPVTSYQRLRFDKHEFYVKSEEEVRSHFDRHKSMWTQEFIDSMIDVSSELADACESSEWIDPKFSNPSGKELPEFPVRDQADYADFVKWKGSDSEWIIDADDDVLYYRYLVELGLQDRMASGKLSQDKMAEYKAQITEELDVLEYHGFASYMLIVVDYIQWCNKQEIPVGPGRGCLTGDTDVLTDKGFVKLDSVSVGDNVFTHKGRVRKVYNKFEYDIDEVGLSIGTNYSFDNINLTKDHKVYASHCFETEEYMRVRNNGLPSIGKVKRWEGPSNPNWIKSEDLSVGDYIFMPFPDRSELDVYNFKKIWDNESFDLANNYSSPKSDELEITDNKIIRFLKKDDELLYIIGRWIGDGWSEHTSDKGYLIGFAFHSDDVDGVDRISEYFELNGFDIKRYDSKNKKLVRLVIKGSVLHSFFSSIISDYKCSSKTKHLPDFFRHLHESGLRSLLSGLCDSDGRVEVVKDCKIENLNTTSRRLALEFKEALLYLRIPSSINTREKHAYGNYICPESYEIRFNGLQLDRSTNNLIKYNGYFCRVTSISEVKLDSVYDISVEEDVSYLTSNYAVHNSVGGCFTAYLVGIHEADPFKYQLIFSRFHNKQKTSFPDIDTDFSPQGRERLHAYIRGKYGDEFVAHVSNINTMTPKVYARDIARVFDFGDDGRTASAAIGDDIADSISPEYSRVTTALEQAPLFMEYAKQYPELGKFSILGGKARAWSTHAAGLIIGKRPLHEVVPLRRDPHGALCLEYTKDTAEDNGLVKMDTLGLETLDIIKRTYSIIKEVGKTPPSLPFDYDKYDKKTYDLISRGDVFCVFQLAGVAGPVCKTLQPQSVEDIALVTALIRPAAKAIINDFMKVRNGEEELTLMHPTLDRALSSTYGFALYEESLMFMAADVAGWDLHKADDLRKMTKAKGKYPEKVEALRASFIEDAPKANDISTEDATRVWDELIASFGGYGFNRTHAVLYSMISFHTAYLKANFPLEFLVSNLMTKVKSSHPKAKDEVNKIKAEIRALGVKIVPPDINTSDISYRIIDRNTLMTGLDSLRNVKEGPIGEILDKRPFKDLKDIISRTDASNVRAPVIQALAAAGALDDFKMKREHMFFYCSDYRKKIKALESSLKKKVEKKTITQVEADIVLSEFEYPFPDDEPSWKPYEVFALEEKYLGEGITGSVQDRFPKFFDKNITSFTSLAEKVDFIEYSEDEKENRRANTHNIQNHGISGLKGIVSHVFEFKVKKEDSKIFGQIMARLTVEDPFGNSLNIIAFPSAWDKAKDRVEKELSGGKGNLAQGIAIYFDGFFQWDNEHAYSFILGDILSYKDAPKPPKILKGKSVKMKRTSSVNKAEVVALNKEDLAESLEEELVFDGVSPINDDDNGEFSFR